MRFLQDAVAIRALTASTGSVTGTVAMVAAALTSAQPDAAGPGPSVPAEIPDGPAAGRLRTWSSSSAHWPRRLSADPHVRSVTVPTAASASSAARAAARSVGRSASLIGALAPHKDGTGARNRHLRVRAVGRPAGP